ncbi:hypothetical protein AMJ52_09815 [candidate division TA06 bacterium DG_78]|uniref:Secretion system C-terminal sorting domain-containing protein n=1 Tax=candidate division TA06 bacterium DG_78 TaxID=1703772 RepID=A0A0S7Y7A5_UNCT6|nr:MAG: hypothetical protein AMJ52_09815 [candidate division TA06 bacterium DG_78]
MQTVYKVMFLLILSAVVPASGARYAIVVSNATNSAPGWSAVVESLVVTHGGQVFTWQDTVGEVQSELASYKPDYIAFVGQPSTEINQAFVTRVWFLTRDLDADPYGDAIWGIITGYDYDDAMRIVQNQMLEVKTVLGGTNCTWDSWFYQGISTFEAEYNRIRFKIPDTTLIIDTICPPRCPDDRCTLLVNYINNGISDTILGYSVEGDVDYFVTSGHGNVNVWQLHYPTADLEGYFRSNAGQLYGDPHDGDDRDINSTNPKIYNAMGNCLVGNPNSVNNMPYAWLRTGGAIAMTGYMPVTTYGYMLWGLGGLFQMSQDRYTYAEAFWLNNQELLFDQINETPGTDPYGLNYDKNACCYYGDPAAEIRMYPWREPWWDQGLDIVEGTIFDTISFWIEANYDSVDPGFSGTSGRRHPFAFFPYRYDSTTVIDSNCYEAVITDNFVLMYCWKQGDQKLGQGEMRWVTFIGYKDLGIQEQPVSISPPPYTFTVVPTIAHQNITIHYEIPATENIRISVYDAMGRLVKKIADEYHNQGVYEWDIHRDTIAAGVYFVKLETDDITETKHASLLVHF